MEGYLGEEQVPSLVGTPFEECSQQEWALYFIERYGQIDGAHHKQWVLDQVARILNGTPIEVRIAKWSNGHSEYRVSTGTPSEPYLDWVLSMRGEHDETTDTYEYDYDEGVPP